MTAEGIRKGIISGWKKEWKRTMETKKCWEV